MEQTQSTSASRLRPTTYEIAIAGVLGALAIVLSFTPLGMIPVPNPTEAATTLHLPAIVGGVLAGPVVGGLVGLVLAISSWYQFSATFLYFADGNLALALLAAFAPRVLIGVVSYYVYRLLRHWPVPAAGAAGLAGTLTNTVGVLGSLYWLGSFPLELLLPALYMNVPIEIGVALVITIPVVAAVRAARRGQITAARD